MVKTDLQPNIGETESPCLCVIAMGSLPDTALWIPLLINIIIKDIYRVATIGASTV